MKRIRQIDKACYLKWKAAKNEKSMYSRLVG